MNNGVLPGLSRVNLGSDYGPIALRPTVGPFVGYIYFASDVSGGTPYRWNGSSWNQVGAGVQDTSGRELGYATTGANFTTGSTSPVDYTGLSVPVTVGVRPIVIEVHIPWITQTSATAIVYVFINEGATIIASDVVTIVNGAWGFVHVKARLGGTLQPSAGSHTYKVQTQVSAGSITSYSTALQAGIIPYIQVVEC